MAPIRLRAWCAEDIPMLVATFRHPDLGPWLQTRIDDEDAAREWLAFQAAGRRDGSRYAFAVLDDAERPAGNVVLKTVDGLLDAGGAPVGEIGYWTAPEARGRGLAPRAVAALSTWALGPDAPSRYAHLELLHAVPNRASCRVAEKSGFPLARALPPSPPQWPHEGHLHVRRGGEQSA